MFLFPPRPEKAIAPSLIKFYEGRGYIAQLKKNGTCTVISVDNRGTVSYYTRTGEAHKAWSAPDHITKTFAGFKSSVFVGELLHNKHPSVKNTIVLFDVVKFLGRDLVGQTLLERLAVLGRVVPLNQGIQIATCYRKDFLGLYESLRDPIDEGIVLKNPKAKLLDCRREGLNGSWQVKCRKQHKNYSF